MHSPTAPSRVTTAQVFAIAGPAMVAMMDDTADRHRLDDCDRAGLGRGRYAARRRGDGLATDFDWPFWRFGFLRMNMIRTFTAQLLGAGETSELRAILMRGTDRLCAGWRGADRAADTLATVLRNAMGGSDGVTHAVKTASTISLSCS